MRVRSLERAVWFCYSFKFMHSSYLFLFGTKKAVPDIWSSNWNWVFTCFNFAGWLYIVKFQKSSRIRMRWFLKSGKKNTWSSFWINLIYKCCDIYNIQFLYIENFVWLEWLFSCSNIHLLQICPLHAFVDKIVLLCLSYMLLPQATLYVAMDIWMV